MLRYDLIMSTFLQRFGLENHQKMDLYGDLPPAQGCESEASSTQPTVAYGTTKLAVEKVKLVVKTAPKVSSSLAFKPRQTVPSVQTSRTITAVAQKQQVENNYPEVNQTVVSSATLRPETQVSRLESEFNTNSSYDVDYAYDPKIPNDYIAYCSERLEKRKQLRLQEENARHMQAAEEARTQLENERREAAQRGDYQSLLSSAGVYTGESSGSNTNAGEATVLGASMGRGRGRGLNNLPAWMTQQIATTATNATASNNTPTNVEQFADSQAPAAAAVVGVKRKQQGQFSKPSCVLLLKNMVSAEEADDQLAAETSQECLKYGAIISCVVQVESATWCPEDEKVRTFVEFERQDSAIRAFR